MERRLRKLTWTIQFQLQVFLSFLYWNEDVRREYRKSHQEQDNLVQLNDVIFALHALFFTSVTLLQATVLYPRAGRPYPLSDTSWFALVSVGLSMVVAIVLTVVHMAGWVSLLFVVRFPFSADGSPLSDEDP